MGDFGSSTELTEINASLLKKESMGSLETVKEFISNNSVQILMAGILVLGVMAMFDDKKAKR